MKNPKIKDVFKRAVLPRLEYVMMNSMISKTKLAELNMLIRSIINDFIGG
jgi:hypothetical protein